MGTRILLIISCTILVTAAWSPYYPGPRGPMRFTRYAPSPHQLRQYPHQHPHLHAQLHAQIHPQHHPQHHTQQLPQQHPQILSQTHSQPHLQPEHKNPVESAEVEEKQRQRPKRGHDYDHVHDHDHDHRGTSGVTGPVHTFVKTDKNANYKWGVRHHVGDKYAS